MQNNDQIKFAIIDLDDNNIDFKGRNSSITPALWVDKKFWFAGNFNKNAFDSKLRDLIDKKRRL